MINLNCTTICTWFIDRCKRFSSRLLDKHKLMHAILETFPFERKQSGTIRVQKLGQTWLSRLKGER